MCKRLETAQPCGFSPSFSVLENPAKSECLIKLEKSPFCYIHRFFSKLFGKNRKRVRSRWKATMNQDPNKIRSTEELLQAVGLK